MVHGAALWTGEGLTGHGRKIPFWVLLFILPFLLLVVLVGKSILELASQTVIEYMNGTATNVST